MFGGLLTDVSCRDCYIFTLVMLNKDYSRTIPQTIKLSYIAISLGLQP